MVRVCLFNPRYTQYKLVQLLICIVYIVQRGWVLKLWDEYTKGYSGASGRDFLWQRTQSLPSFKLIALNIMKHTF